MEYHKFDVSFEQLSSRLREEGKLKDLAAAFAELTSDEERFQFVWCLSTVHEVFAIPSHSAFTKTSVQSEKLRKDGNAQFQKKNYRYALKLYTDSIAHAPDYHSEVATTTTECGVAVVFANRSAALYHLEDYEACLGDIKRAFGYGYPEPLHFKLHDREGKCLMKQGKHHLALAAFDRALGELVNSELSEKAKGVWERALKKQQILCQDKGNGTDAQTNSNAKQQAVRCVEGVSCVRDVPCFNQEGTLENHKVFNSLSSLCDVVYSSDKGRYIVAGQDIAPGAVILVEKPFASVLLPEHYDTHCHHCLTRCAALVPCYHCSTAHFCSVQCLRDALAQYHHYECPILTLLHQSGLGKFAHLALRAITRSSEEDLAEYHQKVSSGQYVTNDDVMNGSNAAGLYLANNYCPIHMLVTHARDRLIHDLFRRAMTAAFLLKCLQMTSFFGAEDADTTSLEGGSSTIRMFVGGLLLSHLQSFPCNAHEISELELDQSAVASSLPVELGAGIYSTLSLFNHSCDPVANRNFYKDTCVVRTIKGLKKGEEVSDNYGAVYAVQSREERQQKLKLQYFFDCSCKPCLGDWPLYPGIEHTAPVWLCTACGSPLEQTKGQLSGMANCLHCNATQDISSNFTRLQASRDHYQQAFEELLTCNVGKALPGLLGELEAMEELVCAPWREYNNCQEAIKQCFSIMANCHLIKT